MTNTKIDLNLLKDSVNFYELALFFNEEKIKVSYNAVMMCCPFHKEKTPSFSYHLNKKFFYCFGCAAKGDVIDYVYRRLNLRNLREAIDFLITFTGHDPKEKLTVDNKLNYKKQINTFNKYNKRKENLFTYFTEEQITNMVQFRPDFFEKDGFAKEVLDEFGVGFDFSEKRLVVPIRDENGVLVGATGRTILNKEEMSILGIPKWRHYKGSNINENLFNINKAISASKNADGSIILVEGPKDVMWLHQQGFKNTIALLSNNLTQVQKGLLLKNFLAVYIFLDGDSGGENGKSSILNKIKGYFNIYDVKTPSGKDPDNMTKEEIEDAIKNAKKL